MSTERDRIRAILDEMDSLEGSFYKLNQELVEICGSNADRWGSFVKNSDPIIKTKSEGKPDRFRRKRRSLSNEATLACLRKRPNEKFPESEIITMISEDNGRTFSGQAINAALKWAVESGLAIKSKAPAGTSARYAYQVVASLPEESTP